MTGEAFVGGCALRERGDVVSVNLGGRRSIELVDGVVWGLKRPGRLHERDREESWDGYIAQEHDRYGHGGPASVAVTGACNCLLGDAARHTEHSWRVRLCILVLICDFGNPAVRVYFL